MGPITSLEATDKLTQSVLWIHLLKSKFILFLNKFRLRKHLENPQIIQQIKIIESREEHIFISCITYFEIRRGFLAVDAPKQRKKFEEFCKIYQNLHVITNLCS